MAQVVVELTGDEQKLLKSYQKIRGAQNQMDKGLQKAKRGHKESFGSRAAQEIRNYALQFMGVQKALEVVQRAWRDVEQARKEAAQGAEQEAKGMGPLAQLAATAGSKEAVRREMYRMRGEARKTFGVVGGGGEEMKEALGLQFSLESAQQATHRALIARLQAAEVVSDPETLVNKAAALQAGMTREETGDIRNIISALLGAAKQAPAKISPISETAAKGASGALELGMPLEELLAAATTVTKVREEGARARIEQLFAQMEKKGLKEPDQPFIEAIQALQTRVGAGESAWDILGEKRAVEGFRDIRNNLELYRDTMKDVTQGMEKDYTGLSLYAAEDIMPKMIATQAKGRGEARGYMAFDQTGAWENLADAIIADRVADVRERKGDWRATFEKWAMKTDRLLSGSSRGYIEELRQQRKRAQRDPLITPPEIMTDEHRRVYRKLTEAIERLEEYEKQQGQADQLQKAEDTADQLNQAASNLNDASSETRRQREAAQGVPE